MAGIPQMPSQAPRSAPRSAPSGGNFNGPVGGMPGGGFPNSGADTSGAFNQNSGFSEQQKIQRSVAKSKKNAGVLKAVKVSRQQLEQWLAQFGLKLLTSSVELQMTHNFINSSYVVYPNETKISLPMFLKQTDQNIQDMAHQISQQMVGIASHLEVMDPNSGRNPFEQQFYNNMPAMDMNQALYQPQPAFYPQQNPNQIQNGYPNPNYYPPQPQQGYYQPQPQYPQQQFGQAQPNYPQQPQPFYPNPQLGQYPPQN